MSLENIIRAIEKAEDENAIQALRETIGNELKRSLFNLCTIGLGYHDVNKRTHGKMIAALEADTKRKLIVMPRGSLKSSIGAVAYPIWLLINNPNERILIDSQLYSNSTTYLREIKGHLEGPFLAGIFGKFKTKNNWNSDEIIIAQRTKNYKEASITCGGIGTTKVGQHYSVICGDDYNSPSNTNTAEAAEKVINHFRYNASILEPGGTYVLIGTRYSDNDLLGCTLSNELGIDDVEAHRNSGKTISPLDRLKI